ncbi:MAG: hypothetical protein DMF91_09165 [Acidobacteria bacterium]|nr:MAG: hypothetical protein DMF91_09165 [Acidobacteriota bacterium]
MTGAAAAFLRFSRDKRGYEHFYLVQPTTNRRGKTRARILYWFRTPPGVRVGRLPFDADVQRTIEAQNPGVTFDWKRLLATPIPPPSQDVERWRERRRLERAEKAARRALRAADAEVAPEMEPEDAGDVEAGLGARPEDDEIEGLRAGPEGDDVGARLAVPEDEDPTHNSQPASSPLSVPPSGKRRRRRRGRRRNKGPAGGGSPSSNGVD